MEIPVLSAQQILAEVKKSLEDRSSSIEAVCFDFFDTLVARSVTPEETKKIAAAQLADLLPEGITADLLYRIRSVLERQECAENLSKGLDPEFNLITLAKKLFAILSPMAETGILTSPDAFVTILVDIELAVEQQVQVLRHDVVEILRYCHEQGRKTIVISDFYLPAAHFTKLLGLHGLAESVDDLFISADFSLNKGHSGRLYDVVCRTLDLPPGAMLMIGDNVHADGRMARARGLSCYCLQQSQGMVSGMERTESRMANDTEKVYSSLFAVNKASFFPEMGLTLHFFIHNLFLQAVRDCRQTLFFCSKEGEFLRKLFICYQEIRFGRQVIDSHYLYVSRKATYICSCRDIDSEDFHRLFVHYRDLSLLEFLQSLNLSQTTALDLCHELHLEPLTRHQDLKTHKDFRTLFCSDIFRACYESHRQYQRENFLNYLDSFGIDFFKDGLALVDVGWKGSIQNNIFQTFAGRVRVSGYYIGLLSPTEVFQNNEKKGILFADVPEHSPFIHVFNNNRSLFEMMLGASHGSADGYFTEKERAIVGNTRQSSFIEDGCPLVTVLDLPEERKLYNELIAPLQEVYYTLNEALSRQLLSTEPTLPSLQWFARRHARMVFKPTPAEIDFYSGLYHLENFGLFEFTAFQKGQKLPVLARMKNLRNLLRDPAGHLETGVWPPIILRRLGLDFLIRLEGRKRYKTVFGKYR